MVSDREGPMNDAGGTIMLRRYLEVTLLPLALVQFAALGCDRSDRDRDQPVAQSSRRAIGGGPRSDAGAPSQTEQLGSDTTSTFTSGDTIGTGSPAMGTSGTDGAGVGTSGAGAGAGTGSSGMTAGSGPSGAGTGAGSGSGVGSRASVGLSQ
jgi:hypothetical protein